MELMTMSEAFLINVTNSGGDRWLFFQADPFVNLGLWTYDEAVNINMLYFQFRSGQKYYMGDMAQNVNSRITPVANSIALVCGENWKRLYATLKPPDYDPLTNYKMQETAEGEESSTRTPDLTKGDTGTVQTSGQDKRTPDLTRTGTGTVKDNGSGTNKNQNGIWGFNSSESVPSDKSDGVLTNENTTTRDLTDTETGTDTTDHTNTDTYNRSYTETGTDTTAGKSSRKLTRTGNIGTNTFQNLINQERDLWKWNFYEQVFRDVDSVLTIPIY